MTAGYAFVPLPDHVRRCPRPHARHDRRVPNTLAGALRCEWLTEQPLHVGSGFKALVGDAVVREAARVRGRPGVPGSSLKGVLRARYEAITRSCTDSPGNREAKIRSSKEKYAGHTARIDHRATNLDVFRAACRETLCPACALFGKMSLRSRVTVDDLLAAEPCAFTVARMPKQFSPNLHHLGHYRDEPGKQQLVVHTLHGRKFAVSPAPQILAPKYAQVEVLPVAARLVGTVRFVNLTPAELGGLLVALGRHDPAIVGPIKLGGGKCHGFGRARLVGLTLTERGDPSHPREAPVADDPRLPAWLSAFCGDPDCDPTGLARLLEIYTEDC